MSESTGEKTEEPTPKKIKDVREEGQVAHSKDLTHTVLILSLFGYMLADADAIIRRLGQMMILPSNVLGMSFDDALKALYTELVFEAIWLMLPFVLIVIGLGLLTELTQTGMNISIKAITPSGKKLDITNNVKNVFSMKNAVEFLKSNIKIAVLSTVISLMLARELGTLLTLPQADVVAVGVAVGMLLKSMLVQIAVAYIVIALADFAWQRHAYRKEHMMTKDEVKREFKEAEGDPHIKQERKHLHQEMLNESAVERTRKASVVVTNPTHLAIAIVYQAERTPLPLVVAKGEGALAARMVTAARESGVPVLQNVPLARSLMETAQTDQYIPSELIVPVAELLRLVSEMKKEE